MRTDDILEILEKYKLRIPPNVFYELKADICNHEEPEMWGKDGECPHCGYLQQWEDDKFCGNCGAQLMKREDNV